MQFLSKTLPRLTKPKYAVFSDFDETYLAHNMNESRLQHIRQLETFIRKESYQSGLLFGWVTGSSLESVLEKVALFDLQLIPHFVASALGTELHWFSKESGHVEDAAWLEQMQKSGFSRSNVELLVSHLNQRGIKLEPQTRSYQSSYKRSYYLPYEGESTHLQNVTAICSQAKKVRIQVALNRCNPLAGDPEDCYDVDFIPYSSGKSDLVHFVLSNMNLTPDQAFSFGDSGNDIAMLRVVRHGYLVQNATLEARKKHLRVAQGTYADGVLSVLSNFF